MNKPLVIFTSHLNFWERKRGADQRICELIESLQNNGFRVLTFYTGPQHLYRHNNAKPCEIITSCSEIPSPPTYFRSYLRLRGWLRDGVEKLRRLALRRDKLPAGIRTWTEFISEFDRYAFQQLLAREKPSIVIVEYVWGTRLITGLPKSVRENLLTVLDTHDVQHERTSGFIEHGSIPEQGIGPIDECRALAEFDLILAIQEKDKAKFKEMMPGKKVITVMHSHEIHPCNFTEKNKCPSLLFVGTNNAPNRDALEKFIKNAWCEILNQIGCDAELHIVGSVCEISQNYKGIPGLFFQGVVECLDQYYLESDIVVAPLQYGSGLKIKVVEALCHAKPLITTSIGAEGIEEGAGVSYLIADDWPNFVKDCVKLIESESLRKKLSSSAMNFANSKFSKQAAHEEFIIELKAAVK